MKAMTQLPLIMQCTDNGLMVQAQYCSERTELGWYGTLVRFLCSDMIDEGTTSIVCSYLWIWPRGTRTRVVRVYYPPQVLIIDWFLESRHKCEPT